jgi:hypothetical protein
VVAWVHTHPFEKGEWLESCKGRDNNGTGIYIIPTYRGHESDGDIEAGLSINNTLNTQGRPSIDGYVIDNDRIFRSKPLIGTSAMNYAPIDRCGY